MVAAIVACSITLASTGLMAEQSQDRSAEPAPVGPHGSVEARTSEMIKRLARTWFKEEWRAYRTAFVSPEGRIVDNGSGGVSHSEGQGYGLLLAALADDPDQFQLIWRWTQSHLKVRPDNLLAWRWNPADGSADKNNATDGDILVAWALAEGARRFGRSDYLAAAKSIAEAIGAQTIKSAGGRLVLLPGVDGFDAKAQPDGPVVNLSYWVFPAFDALRDLAPQYDWSKVSLEGLKMLSESRFGPLRLPADWQSAKEATPRPAKNFRAEFGYNAIRLPLYLAWKGDAESLRALRRFTGLWSDQSAPGPFVIDVATGSAGQTLDGAGYKLPIALARCATLGREIDPDLTKTRDQLYYPATLRMLSLAIIQERFPQCL